MQLVREFPAEQIQQQIEVFDLLSSQRGASALRNPAGFLVQSIRKGYAPPKGLSPRGDRHGVRAHWPCDHVAATAPGAASDNPNLFYVEQSPFAEYLSQLGTAERQSLEAAALTQAHPIAVEGYRRAVESNNHQRARQYRQAMVEQYRHKTLGTSGIRSA